MVCSGVHDTVSLPSRFTRPQPTFQESCDAINACRRSAQWQGAVAWLKWQGQQERLRPNIIVHSAVVSACEKCRKWCQGVQLMADVPKMSLQCDRVIQNSVMSACQRGECWPAALLTLEALGAAANVVSCSTAMSAWLQSSHWRSAVGLLKYPNAVMYGVALSACEAGGRWQRSLGLLEQLQQEDVQANSIIYNTAISCCQAAIDGWQRAASLLVTDSEAFPDEISFNAAISACEKAGEWQWALELLSVAKSLRLASLVGYSAVASATEKGQQWVQALQLLEEATAAQLQLDVIFFSAVLSACEKCEEWQRALLIFEDIHGNLKLDLVAYNATISACEKGSRWQEALSLLQTLFLERLEADIVSYCATISACRGAPWPYAMELLTAAPQAGAFNAAASACEKGSQWVLAVHLFDQCHDGLISYNIAMSAWHRGEHWQEALALLAELRALNLALNVITYSVAIGACHVAGRWQWSLNFLRELCNNGHVANLITYNAVMCACDDRGKWQFAISLYEKSQQQDTVTKSIAVKAYATGGRRLETAAMLSELSEQGLQASWRTRFKGRSVSMLKRIRQAM
ncbi:unnamed protein product [Durusdinium trenchii]|uniref:Pentatricopeptide repeat-containing protein, chloroplastic n=1 Tax=Durusdinium trenchii TaxID=1381693 RepID=A0ABP0QQD1_9DINO